VDILNDVKEKRNKGTHQKIDKDFLREMLERMIDFCKLLKTYRMETEKSELFQAQCQSEVANIEIDENPENPENPLY
jgi:DNA repair ATPase RecN